MSLVLCVKKKKGFKKQFVDCINKRIYNMLWNLDFILDINLKFGRLMIMTTNPVIRFCEASATTWYLLYRSTENLITKFLKYLITYGAKIITIFCIVKIQKKIDMTHDTYCQSLHNIEHTFLITNCNSQYSTKNIK